MKGAKNMRVRGGYRIVGVAPVWSQLELREVMISKSVLVERIATGISWLNLAIRAGLSNI